MIRVVLTKLDGLLRNFDNKFDFVQAGYAIRIAVVMQKSGDANVKRRALSALRRCVNDDEAASTREQPWLDVLREEFFRVPGLMEIILRSEPGEVHARILCDISKCERIAGEMLEFPGLVDVVLNMCMAGSVRAVIAASSALTALVSKAPLQALGHPATLSTLMNAVEGGNGMFATELAEDNLLSWQAALNRHRPRPNSNRSLLIAYWRNVLRMWAVLSPHRVKQRSPLRRLPIEMFRMLKETLCGSSGVVWQRRGVAARGVSVKPASEWYELMDVSR